MNPRKLVRRMAAAIPVLAVGAVALAGLSPLRAAERTEITFPDRSYPESITATSDGTLIAGSITEGGAFRIAPGATTAERWIAPGANDSMTILGVYADEKSGTLWACSTNLGAFGVPPPGGAKPVALKAFDLKTGAAKGSYPLPGDKTLCNDMVVGKDGTVYVADSFQPHVLALKPGTKALEVWAESPLFAGEGPQLDGITIAGDGNMYVNSYAGGRLFRIGMGQDGKAGKVTELKLSDKIDHPDGMRPFGNKALLMTEGGGKFDVVRLDGDSAKIEVVKDGLKGPCAVVQVGGTAWVIEGQQNTLFNPNGGKPTTFKVYAVPLPSE